MPISPWSDAAKALVGAAFGNPEMRMKQDELDSTLMLNEARAGEAGASAAAAEALAALRGQELNAKDPAYATETFSLFDEDPSAALGRLVASGVNPQQYATVLSAMGATQPNTSPADADRLGRRALLASNVDPGTDFAADLSGANAVSARDAGEELDKALQVEAAKGQNDINLQEFKYENAPSLAELLGQTVPGGTAPLPANVYGPPVPAPPSPKIPAKPGDFAAMLNDPNFPTALTAAGIQTGDDSLMRMGMLQEERQLNRAQKAEDRLNQQAGDYGKSVDNIAGLLTDTKRLNDLLAKYPEGVDIPGVGSELDNWTMERFRSREANEMRSAVASIG